MKVTLLNTFRKGGAGIACERLKSALTLKGVESRMLIQDPIVHTSEIKSVAENKWDQLLWKFRLAKDVLTFSYHSKNNEDRFQFSIAQSGIDITNNKLIQDTDIIHLHWINQGYLSIDSIKKLKSFGKPMVWTLHDMWAFTGGCHYSRGCTAFTHECNYCPYLKDASSMDLSNKVWKSKIDLFKSSNITIVTCSDWLKQLAQQSPLLRNLRIESIPNPIDTGLYQPIDKYISRKHFSLPQTKKLILFGAVNVNDKRKGINYLLNALKILVDKNPEVKNEVELVVFGQTDLDTTSIPLPVHLLGSLTTTEDLVKAYSSSNLFVLPSLEDNLPNTVMEALSCGVPVVAFNTGGIPEMVTHLSNGFIANLKDADEMAIGIHQVLYASSGDFAYQSRKKVLDHYNQGLVATKYIEIYKSLLV